MRAAVYLRVSTEEQAGPGHASLEVQERQCRAYVKAHGWQLAGVERDTESGLRPHRQGYQRVLELARGGEIDTIVVYAASRFGRRASEVLMRVEELRGLGVELRSTLEDLTSTLMLGIQAVLNEEESRRMVERTMPAKRAKAEQGFWLAHAPFGTVNDRGILKPGEHYDTLRLAFELAAAGVSVTDVTRRLRQALAPYDINYHTVGKILRNEAYVGVVRWGDIVAQARWEPLIDPDVFRRAGAHLRRRYVERRQLSRSHPYWILGLAFCACGHRMTPKVHARSWGTVYPYMTCGRRDREFRYLCRGREYALITEVQDWLVEQLRRLELAGGDGLIARLSASDGRRREEHDRQMDALRAERQRLEARVQRAKAGYLDGTLTGRDVRQVEAGVRDAIREIERQLAGAAFRPGMDIEALRIFLDGRWLEVRDIDPAAFRDLVRCFVSRVVVHGRGQYELRWSAAVEAVHSS